MTNAILGGALIGVAAVLLMLAVGRIAGISGHLRNTLMAPHRNWVSVAFIVSLGVAGALTAPNVTGALPDGSLQHPAVMVLGGLLVGFGTRLGSGCTSGHGVCGIARMSTRSIVATVIFVAVGMFTATMVYA